MKPFKVSILAAGLLLHGLLNAKESVDNGADDRSIPAYKLTRIAKIVVTAPSKSDGYDPKEDCGQLSMTPKRGIFFFRHSRIVSQASAFHDFSYSSCYSEGTVQFVNGDRGEWRISHGGTGTLLLKTGQSKGKFLHLYCKRCDDEDR
ncbi:MAG: hypothetical protein KGL18_10675 [Burkholderiales bacterium]|nr:hypothetical protein [Burkholderiales bacterium]MDE2503420.1 hypothetical protein [Burkholderiales bacterium]